MKRRGTKLQRHLAHLKDTGQMSEWLQRRLEWDTHTREGLFAEMYHRTTKDWMRMINEHINQHMRASIKEQFEKQSVLWKYGEHS